MWILLYWINDFMLANKKLTDNTNLFSPYDFNKNDQLSHEEFVMTLKEKGRYEKMKYNLISEKGDEM